MKYCPECGTKLKDSPKYCPECGSQLEVAIKKTEKDNEVCDDYKKKRNNIPIKKIAIGLIIIFIGVVMLSNNAHQTAEIKIPDGWKLISNESGIATYEYYLEDGKSLDLKLDVINLKDNPSARSKTYNNCYLLAYPFHNSTITTSDGIEHRIVMYFGDGRSAKYNELTVHYMWGTGMKSSMESIMKRELKEMNDLGHWNIIKDRDKDITFEDYAP